LCSLERIQDYLEIEQEQRPKEGGTPPAAWPTSGHLRVEGLKARYSKVCSHPQVIEPKCSTIPKTGPDVLHSLTFEVKSGERVGVGEHSTEFDH